MIISLRHLNNCCEFNYGHFLFNNDLYFGTVIPTNKFDSNSPLISFAVMLGHYYCIYIVIVLLYLHLTLLHTNQLNKSILIIYFY